MEIGSNNYLYFLDLLINKLNVKFDFIIYRKPSFSPTLINCKSNHPMQLKKAVILKHVLTTNEG